MALSGTVKVTAEELRVKSSEAQSFVGTMESCFQRLKAAVEGTNNYWEGSAADAHRASYANKQARIEEMFARYREHIADLQKMAGIYEQADTAAGGFVNDLPVSNL